MHALPSRGSVTFGRLETCEIPILDASVSRRHATLHLGDTLAIEDLGSANGTRVREAAAGPSTTAIFSAAARPGVRVPVAVGEPINIGSTMVLVRPAPIEEHAGVVVHDESMRALHALLERVAGSPINVLLLGETGVGKEILAETLHRKSSRAAGPFLRLNCAALSEQLLESELFGHERGAFTGATSSKAGLLESADAGTVFLDEAGEMPSALQAKLLRVLEDRQVTRVGALKSHAIDVRFVAATNRDLAADVDRGTFRRDLYFRLNGVALTIPPLRERRAEIAPLARAFAVRAARQLNRADPPTLSAGFIARLEAHAWPGNIRELRNAIELAVLLCTGAELLPEHLAVTTPTTSAPPPRVSGPQSAIVSSAPPASEAFSAPTPAAVAGRAGAGLKSELDSIERQRILDALEASDGNQTRAAEVLGMPRRTLIARIEAYGLPRPRKKP